MTRKIPSSTSQAAPVCDPENRESRPSRFGLLRSRMTANVMMPASTQHGEQVLDEPDERPVADAGIANVLLNRSP